MHTVKEAVRLWCPMVRDPESASRCIASECAMWRWEMHPQGRICPACDGGEGSGTARCEICLGAGYTAVRIGYCGLAGRPEQ